MGSFKKYLLGYRKRIFSSLIAGLAFGLVIGLIYGVIGCTVGGIMLFKEASAHIDIMVPETIVSAIYTLVFILGCGLAAGLVSKSIAAGLAYVLGVFSGFFMAGLAAFLIVQSRSVNLIQVVFVAEIVVGLLGLAVIFLTAKRKEVPQK